MRSKHPSYTHCAGEGHSASPLHSPPPSPCLDPHAVGGTARPPSLERGPITPSLPDASRDGRWERFAPASVLRVR